MNFELEGLEMSGTEEMLQRSFGFLSQICETASRIFLSTAEGVVW